jgi:hypothetical protein
MVFMRKLVLWAVPAMALAACSSSGSSSVSADQAASDAATALCNKYNSCSAYFIQIVFGDVGTCAASLKSSLKNALAANGTGATPAEVEACSTAVSGTSCDDALGHNLPSACQPVPGKLANGAACGDSSQCQSAFCHLSANGTCGACAAAPANGASCNTDSDCPAGHMCSNAGTCAPPGAAGAACDPTQRPCKVTLTCKNGTCAASDQAGAACTKVTTAAGTSDNCDALAGLYCNGQAASGTCAKIALATSGQPCGLVNNAATLCSANGTCKGTTATSGTCQAAAAAGGSCDATNGPSCAQPAICVNAVCTLPDPASCK